jgi:hypothetical protein
LLLANDNGVERARLNEAAQRPHGTISGKDITESSFFVDATFHICNLARHVHKAQRHMAIFSTFTITQQLSMVRCFGIFDSASRR